MFSGKWQQNCYLCGDYVFSVSEHLLLDCARLCDIRDILWKRLLNRFGVKYYIEFISYPPEAQIDMLFSGSREILDDKKDVFDCIKIVLRYFEKLPSPGNIII